MAAITLGVLVSAPRKSVRKPAPSSAQRLALIDKLCKTLGTQYRGLKQYRSL